MNSHIIMYLSTGFPHDNKDKTEVCKFCHLNANDLSHTQRFFGMQYIGMIF